MKNSAFRFWCFQKWIANIEEHQTYGQLRLELDTYIRANRWFLRSQWRREQNEQARREKFSQ
jgi:hypothetical protein